MVTKDKGEGEGERDSKKIRVTQPCPAVASCRPGSRLAARCYSWSGKKICKRTHFIVKFQWDPQPPYCLVDILLAFLTQSYLSSLAGHLSAWFIPCITEQGGVHVYCHMMLLAQSCHATRQTAFRNISVPEDPLCPSYARGTFIITHLLEKKGIG